MSSPLTDLLHPDSLFLVLKGTAHQNLSDFPFLYPSIMKKIKQAGTADPLVSWSKGCRPASLDFIFKHLDQSWIHPNFKQRGFLEALKSTGSAASSTTADDSVGSEKVEYSKGIDMYSHIDKELFDDFLVGEEAFAFLYDGIRQNWI